MMAATGLHGIDATPIGHNLDIMWICDAVLLYAGSYPYECKRQIDAE